LRKSDEDASSGGSIINRKNADLVAERMTTRLQWARESLSALWKDPSVKHRRPQRYEMTMDANWWTWNILLAISPGILIAVYCEYVVTPQMRQQHLEQHGSLPPPPPTWRESILEIYNTVMIDYLQFQEAPQQPDEANTTPTTADGLSILPGGNATTTRPLLGSLQDQQLQELQALKRQLETLEAQIIQGGGVNDDEGASISSSRQSKSLSPIQQRRLERQAPASTSERITSPPATTPPPPPPRTTSVVSSIFQTIQEQVESYLSSTPPSGEKEEPNHRQQPEPILIDDDASGNEEVVQSKTRTKEEVKKERSQQRSMSNGDKTTENLASTTVSQTTIPTPRQSWWNVWQTKK
jgi:hypothetical protein